MNESVRRGKQKAPTKAVDSVVALRWLKWHIGSSAQREEFSGLQTAEDCAAHLPLFARLVSLFLERTAWAVGGEEEDTPGMLQAVCSFLLGGKFVIKNRFSPANAEFLLRRLAAKALDLGDMRDVIVALRRHNVAVPKNAKRIGLNKAILFSAAKAFGPGGLKEGDVGEALHCLELLKVPPLVTVEEVEKGLSKFCGSLFWKVAVPILCFMDGSSHAEEKEDGARDALVANRRLSEKLGEKTKEVEELHRGRERIESEMALAKMFSDALQGENEELRKQVCSLESKLGEEMEENERLMGEKNDELMEVLEQMEATLSLADALEKENLRINEEMSKLQGGEEGEEDLGKRVEDLQNELEKAKATSGDERRLEEKLKGAEEKEKELQQKLEDLETAGEKEKELQQKLEEKLKGAEEKEKELQQKLEEAAKEKSSLNDELERAAEREKDLQEKLEEARESANKNEEEALRKLEDGMKSGDERVEMMMREMEQNGDGEKALKAVAEEAKKQLAVSAGMGQILMNELNEEKERVKVLQLKLEEKVHQEGGEALRKTKEELARAEEWGRELQGKLQEAEVKLTTNEAKAMKALEEQIRNTEEMEVAWNRKLQEAKEQALQPLEKAMMQLKEKILQVERVEADKADETKRARSKIKELSDALAGEKKTSELQRRKIQSLEAKLKNKSDELQLLLREEKKQSEKAPLASSQEIARTARKLLEKIPFPKEQIIQEIESISALLISDNARLSEILEQTTEENKLLKGEMDTRAEKLIADFEEQMRSLKDENAELSQRLDESKDREVGKEVKRLKNLLDLSKKKVSKRDATIKEMESKTKKKEELDKKQFSQKLQEGRKKLVGEKIALQNELAEAELELERLKKDLQEKRNKQTKEKQLRVTLLRSSLQDLGMGSVEELADSLANVRLDEDLKEEEREEKEVRKIDKGKEEESDFGGLQVNENDSGFFEGARENGESTSFEKNEERERRIHREKNSKALLQDAVGKLNKDLSRHIRSLLSSRKRAPSSGLGVAVLVSCQRYADFVVSRAEQVCRNPVPDGVREDFVSLLCSRAKELFSNLTDASFDQERAIPVDSILMLPYNVAANGERFMRFVREMEKTDRAYYGSFVQHLQTAVLK